MKLLNSARFQGVLLIGLLEALVLFNVITTEQGLGLTHIVQTIIGVAVAIRTVDKNFGKIK